MVVSLRHCSWLVVSGALFTIYCGGGDSTEPSTPQRSVNEFVTGLTSLDGTRATLQSGVPPSQSGGPSVTATANGNVINGGSNVARLQTSQAFQTIYTAIGNNDATNRMINGLPVNLASDHNLATVDGYYQLRLPSPTTDATITFALARDIPATSFDAAFSVATASGAVGSVATVRQTKLTAASGDVQVSVSWNSASDVDLHVVDPRGEEIYYANPTSASGGRLDLDSNAGCVIDNKNNENIRWTSNAPNGTYTVRVDYWSACNVSSTNYSVSINNGGSNSLFTGSFTGSGDQGGAGSGRTITTFNRGSGLTFEIPASIRPPALFEPSPAKIRKSVRP